MRLLVAGETLSAIDRMVSRHETFAPKFLKGLSHAVNAGKEVNKREIAFAETAR